MTMFKVAAPWLVLALGVLVFKIPDNWHTLQALAGGLILVLTVLAVLL